MTNARSGIIVGHYGVAVEVLFTGNTEKEMIRVKRNSGHVVGDSVSVSQGILTRLERKSELSRMDMRGVLHVVSANLDILCIVATCEPLPPPGFIDRAIVASRAAGLRPVLILNKSDLACFSAYQQLVAPVYQDCVTIFSMSADNGVGIEELNTFLCDNHRSIFVGPTGVGKSSILNALLPNANLQTGEISASKKRGRHTTTVSTLHLLGGGGELIDSPGFNDFGLVDLNVQELALYFPGFEIADNSPCRFRDCKHKIEPGCTILDMVTQGTISRKRYITYTQLLAEVEAIENEPKFRERRNRRKK